MTSGGLGTMGYGLPASVGVQLAHPKSLVIDIAGEASVLMTMQELSRGAVPSADQDLLLNNITWAWCGNGRNCCTAGATRKATARHCRIS